MPELDTLVVGKPELDKQALDMLELDRLDTQEHDKWVGKQRERDCEDGSFGRGR